ncbi:MAG: 2Fe-2S iron-sulfur cluster-binding protein [Flavobacteriaceae bacterium]|nr:2Fe-2S iron-sulfur cluster-binding protein [Flavobacteriaceae bacterium]MDH3796487.1 2Fe-2S iron-sulfur cluster-binding protein [Flavobacteriaceae bacterium]
MPSYTITINNAKKPISADPDTPLLWIIRDNLGLTRTKFGCGKGICGTCTVNYRGKSVRSCTLTIASALEGLICHCGTYSRIRKAIHLATNKKED